MTMRLDLLDQLSWRNFAPPEVWILYSTYWVNLTDCEHYSEILSHGHCFPKTPVLSTVLSGMLFLKFLRSRSCHRDQSVFNFAPLVSFKSYHLPQNAITDRAMRSQYTRFKSCVILQTINYKPRINFGWNAMKVA